MSETVPLYLVKLLIDVIKDNSLLVIYYPRDNWLTESKFLNCDKAIESTTENSKPEINTLLPEEYRDEIIYADLNNNNKH